MQPIHTTLFLDVLAQLEVLPANAPVWQEVTIFVAELCRLQEEALTRAAAHTLREQQDQLAQAATAIFRRYAETLKPFEVGPAGAVILNLDASQASLEAAQQDVAALERALTEYAALAHMERDTITQRRNIRNKEERLEHEIEDILAQLHHWCSLVPSTDPPVGSFSLDAELETKSPDASTTAAADEVAEAESPSIFVAELTAELNDALTTALATALANAVDAETVAEGIDEGIVEGIIEPTAVPLIEVEPHDDSLAELPSYADVLPTFMPEYESTLPSFLGTDLGDGSELIEPHETKNDGGSGSSAGIEMAAVPDADLAPLWVPSVAHELTAEGWLALFWQLVEEGDLAAAYWLACSLPLQPEPTFTPLSDWQIAALQASWWLPSGRGALAQDLTEIVYTNNVDDSAVAQIAGVAAAIVPTLTHPATSISGWLKSLEGMPNPLNDIIAAIETFASHGQPLDEADVAAVRGADQRAQELAQLIIQAQLWLQQGPHRRTSFKRASDVWRVWSSPGGRLHQMVEVVANNRRHQAEQLRQWISDWRGTPVSERINETDLQIMGKVPDRKSRFIDGFPRTWLITQAEEAADVVERWLMLIRADADTAGWHQARVEELVRVVEQHAYDALNLLQNAEDEWAIANHKQTVRLLRWAVADLCSLLGISTDAAVPPRKSVVYPQYIEPGLLPALRFRLLLIPELALSGNQTAGPDELHLVAPALWHTIATGRTPEQALAIHLTRMDIRFGEVLLRNLPQASAAKWARIIEQTQRTVETRLELELQKVTDAVEQAYVEGLLDEGERAAFANSVESVRADNRPDYADRFARLAVVRDTLAENRHTRLHHQQDRWQTVEQRLSTFAGDDHQALVQQISRFMATLIVREDVVVIDERLARLEELLDQNLLPRFEEFALPRRRDVYREFVRFLREWELSANVPELRLGHLRGRLTLGELPPALALTHLHKSRIAEVRDAVERWHSLHQVKPDTDSVAVRLHVAQLLRYLGFTLNDLEERTVVVQRSGPDWAYLTADMTAAQQSPVPQYGSLHSGTFDLVCLWERPETEVIGSRLHNLKLRANHVLVFYLGRLTSKRRLSLMNYMRQQALSMLMLDEYLLLFLAREPSRLSSFFRCALPLASLNPYVETGPVAREMFKGRASELIELQDEGGYAIVYGGRQLGKSALLQRVEEEFHNPAADYYVIRTDIQHIGDPSTPQADPELIWQRLKSGLEQHNLIPRTVATKPATIRDRVRDSISEHPRRRVLVLFDEADNFLAADQARNFEIVSTLRTLMDDTQRRFKTVFTGLHNVQRYEGVPNQPFAHLRGLEVGPLDPQSARDLIVEPLEALGFRFNPDDPSPMLGILAYTNSHPGLIQLFCQKLLNLLYRHRVGSIGPWPITRQDVEEVYCQSDVQEGIRRRFEWTLNLDVRYKALAQIMVLEQLEERNGFSAAYGTTTLRELAQLYWPQAFDNTSLDEFRGYLNEMVGLGVFVRTKQNEYRLRSPNLVRLMGSATDIRASLDELAKRSVGAALVPDSHHAPLDETATRYSPFTFAQARALNERRYGVGLIFGSLALGIDQAAVAVQRHFALQHPHGRAHEIPATVNTSDALVPWLKRVVDTTARDVDRIFVYRRMRLTKEAMADLVETAISFCAKRKSNQRQWMRILFIFDAAATAEWLQLAPELRADLESNADALVCLRTWNDLGISQRLRQHNKIESTKLLHQLQLDLGGWPWLLDQLADTWGSGDDPQPAVQRLLEQIEAPPLRDQFMAACGLHDDAKHRRLLEVIIGDKGIPLDWLVPEYFNHALTQEECLRYVEYLRRMGLAQERLQPTGTFIVANPLIARSLA
jgi:hypothetical protein